MVGGFRALLYSILVLSGFSLPGSNVLLISSNYTGQATGGAYLAATPDGRYVAFVSNATDLEGSDTNSSPDVYLLDRLTGTRRCISSPSNLPPYLTYSTGSPVISDDGRFVGFCCNNPSLIPSITNYPGHATSRPLNLFIYDTVSNRYFLGSPNGNAATAWPDHVSEVAVSGDGKYSSFRGSSFYLYRCDLEAARTELVNVDANGGGATMLQAIARTPDHQYFVFASSASNVVAGLEKTDRTAQVYWRDMDQGVTRLVSVAANGGYANTNCFVRAVSDDGRYVAFRSRATNLQSGMGGHQFDDLFIRDMIANETWCLTVNSNGTASLGNAGRVQHEEFTADSSMLLFQTSEIHPLAATHSLYIHHLSERGNRLLATNTFQGITRLSHNGQYALFARATSTFTLMSIAIETLRTQRICDLGGWSSPFSALRVTADGRWTFFTSLSDVFAAPTISPRIEGVVGANARTVEATAYPGDTVRLQRSSDLMSWDNVTSGQASEDGTLTLQDSATINSNAFYRLVTP